MSGSVVVLGAGLSGLTCALTLKENGHLPLVLTHHTASATSLSSGLWRVGKSEFKKAWNKDSFKQSLSHLPWSKNIEPNSLVSSIEWIKTQIDLKLEAFWESANLFLSANGKVEIGHLAQQNQATWEWGKLSSEKIGVLGIASTRYFHATLAEMWQKQLSSHSVEISLEPVEINLHLERSDVALSALAMGLTQDNVLKQNFKEAFAKVAGQFTHWIFPPIFLDPKEYSHFSEEFKVKITESLNPFEPVAGWRLQQALLKKAREKGIPIVQASSIQYECFSKTVKKLIWKENKTQTRQEPVEAVVLASGKFFSQGFNSLDGQFFESLFHLPLFYNKGEFLSGRETLKEGLASCGIWTDEVFRPLNREREVAFENLFACGSSLGGLDYLQTGHGHGVDALTGRLCAGQI